MAVSANSYLSNSIATNAVGADFNERDSSTVPKYALGHCIDTQDGRRFRYSQFGEATTRGKLCSHDVSEVSTASGALVVVAPSSAVTTTDGTSGQRYIEITEPVITADLYAGAYLIVAEGTGRGATYRVRGNTVTGLPGGPASGNLRMELYENLMDTLTVNSDTIVVGSTWNNLETSDAADLSPAGVTCADQAADDYGWVQTRGQCCPLQDGTVTLGSICTVSDVLDGAVMQLAGYDASNDVTEAALQPIVGYGNLAVSDTAAEGTYIGVYLTLE